MASTILYKFRSGTTFEALPLPGSAARLFDVKKAIVFAKKLDSGGMEFDLAVRNADTNEDYIDESMVLPRGTRLVVQRLPAARGHGFLARVARNEQVGGHGAPPVQPHSSAPGGYYTIEAGNREEEDEFVSTSNQQDDSKELAALQAVTNMRPDGPAMSGGFVSASGPAGRGRGAGGPPGFHKPTSFRPNADPELREQEKQLMPKKRATGIPRTFLSLSAPPQTDGTEGESNVPLLQPNKIGFEELKNRGGGQSESAAGTKKDLDYALKITATTIPEYLQCPICLNVVKNAMLLPWDPEGRTTCESCIRDALAQNGFRCPLTGQDGVSPDDLIPNVGLRKAAENFIQGVMEKIEEIEKQQVDDGDDDDAANAVNEATILEGENAEKGVLVSKRTSLSIKNKSEDDAFGEDPFGGDVFATEAKKKDDEPDVDGTDKKEEDAEETKEEPKAETPKKEVKDEAANGASTPQAGKPTALDTTLAQDTTGAGEKESAVAPSPQSADGKQKQERTPTNRDRNRRRGPPVGYAMGPAGGAVAGPYADDRSGREETGSYRSQSPTGSTTSDRYHDSSYHGRGRGGRGGRGSRSGYGDDRRSYDDDRSYASSRDDRDNRGTKRSWDERSSDDRPRDRGSRGGDYGDSGRGGYRGGRGGGDYGGRGGGRFGGRGRGGGFRGRGRGGYRGRGRY